MIRNKIIFALFFAAVFLFFLVWGKVYAGFSVNGVTDPASVSSVDTPASVCGVDSNYSTCCATNCKLLLNMNGTDEAQVFTDEGSIGFSMTAVGNVNTETSVKKFGTASGEFDGTGDYVYAGDDISWLFGSAEFTVDCWVYLNESMGTAVRIIAGYGGNSANWGTDGNVWVLLTSTDSKIYFQYKVSGSYHTIESSSTVDVTGGFHHVAVVRSSNTTTIYVDGTSVGSDTSQTMLGILTNQKMMVGSSAGQSYFWNGYIDSFRVHKSEALWTSNFTPPTSECSP